MQQAPTGNKSLPANPSWNLSMFNFPNSIMGTWCYHLTPREDWERPLQSGQLYWGPRRLQKPQGREIRGPVPPRPAPSDALAAQTAPQPPLLGPWPPDCVFLGSVSPSIRVGDAVHPADVPIRRPAPRRWPVGGGQGPRR